MNNPPIFWAPSQVVLIVTAGLLFYVALTDLKTFRIRNEIVGLLAGLFLLYSVLSGEWVLLPGRIGFAAAMFIILLLAYGRGALGGGDVKMLTVAFMWTGGENALLFAVSLLGFSLIHIIAAKLKWVRSTAKDGRPRIAYAPSIAGALVVTLMVTSLTSFAHQ